MNIHAIAKLEAEAAKPDPYAELKEAQPEALPFTLPTPPPGMQWHRTDGWTAEMLPPGTRPMYLGEVCQSGDEVSYYFGRSWHKVAGLIGDIVSTTEKGSGFRTTRPLTFEHESHAWTWHRAGDPMPCDGESIVEVLLRGGRYGGGLAKIGNWNNIQDAPELEIIGWRYDDEKPKNPHPKTCGRLDCKVTVTHYEGVPLGPENVPPGSVFRWPECSWVMIDLVCDKGLSTTKHGLIEWKDTQIGGGQINRSIPLAGRWNPDAWEPCHKEAKQ